MHKLIELGIFSGSKQTVQFQNIGLIKKIAIASILVGVVLLIGHELELHLPDLEVWIQRLGAFAPPGFIFFFVILAPLFASVDMLCFAACLLFPIGAGDHEKHESHGINQYVPLI